MHPINTQPNSKGKCLGAPDGKTALNDWTGTFLLDFVSESLQTHLKFHFTHNKSVFFFQLLWYTLVMLSPVSWQFWCFFSYTNLFCNTHNTTLAKIKENYPLLFVQSSCNSYFCNVIAVLSLANWPWNWNMNGIYFCLSASVQTLCVFPSHRIQHLNLGA